jgi:septum formation protein
MPMIILASASPRRRDILTAAGIDHAVEAANVDETPRAGERPHAYAERLARAKASSIAERHPQAIVIGADTVVVVDDRILGKPVDAGDARRMLAQLSGREHAVLTAVAVACRGRLESSVAATSVWMRQIGAAEIDAYVATGEPMDKAGAYAIQGGAAAFVERISGDFDNVVGLPIAVVKRLLSLAAGSYPVR